MKKVAFASKNAGKIASFTAAVQSCGLAAVEVVPVAVDSGVSAQPFSCEETRRGALNRCLAALAAVPEADAAAAAEGGIEHVPRMGGGDEAEGATATATEAFVMGWCCIVVRKDMSVSWGSSARLPLPRSFEREVRAGKELSQVIDAVASKTDLRSSSGVEGLLTGGGLDRIAAYQQAWCCALSRFVTPPELWQ